MILDPTRFEDSPNLATYKESLSYYFMDDKLQLRYYGEKIRFFFFRHFYKNIDVVISCSDFYAQAARDAKLFNEIIVIHNGIKLLRPVPIKNYNHLLYLGRIDRSKGVDILIEAMPEVVQAVPDVQLTIVGDGVLKDFSSNLSKKLNVNQHVAFLGYADHEYAVSLLADATIVITPSLFDNFPTVCIEAMSVGRPVVASRVGGIPEIVLDGKTGLLVSPSDPKELAGAIIALLKDPSRCQDFGRAGRHYAEKEFSVDAYTDSTLSVYERLIAS